MSKKENREPMFAEIPEGWTLDNLKLWLFENPHHVVALVGDTDNLKPRLISFDDLLTIRPDRVPSEKE